MTQLVLVAGVDSFPAVAVDHNGGEAVMLADHLAGAFARRRGVEAMAARMACMTDASVMREGMMENVPAIGSVMAMAMPARFRRDRRDGDERHDNRENSSEGTGLRQTIQLTRFRHLPHASYGTGASARRQPWIGVA
ncbi:hypothetical protein SS37A_19720 [Methylocystis iwaonis]|uniref:Thiolase N-terminal domain-containing protein n=1 Tax=Methylocystis iwaonis TaxID=2885079 RepID=A0ABN6VFK5_9HYPH|nr:hypothetical protein SS37A_19720 [Methylocystis iwaonis]